MNKKCTNILFRWALLLLLSWISALSPSDVYAQEYKYQRLKAPEDVESKVQTEVNKYRFLMMGRQWWDLPTDREWQRLHNARYDRYSYDELHSIYKHSFAEDGVYYRNQADLSEKQNMMILGWHPYWQKDAYINYNFDLITHLAYYAYEVYPFTGQYSNFEAIHDLKTSKLVEMAHLDTCKVLLTVALHGAENNDLFFREGWPIAQENLIDSLIDILAVSGADGVDLSFEEVSIEHKARFSKFVQELSFGLREANNNYIITMSVPIRDPEDVYDLGELKPWVDNFIISGYNFHLKPTELEIGPLSPLYAERTEQHGSKFIHTKKTKLGKLLDIGNGYDIANIYLLHSQEYVDRLVEVFDEVVKKKVPEQDLDVLGYSKYDIAKILKLIRSNGDLQEDEKIRPYLDKTDVDADIVRNFRADEETNFFLFSPNQDTFYINESDIFSNQNFDVISTLDTYDVFGIAEVIENYRKEIGEEFVSGLVLGLPYYGALWYDDPSQEGEEEFEGYIAYAQIRKVIESGAVRLNYDKSNNSMVAEIRDTVITADTIRAVRNNNTLISFDTIVKINGLVFYIDYDTLYPDRKIYFDNSTSLGRKFDYAMNPQKGGIGGVAVWALGYDHGYKDLWNTLEQNFAGRYVWNPEIEKYERFKIAKSNKVAFTIQYNVKRNNNVILATLLIIAIFLAIGFSVSLLDWKVRDVLFYSGAFRIFYLSLFTVLILMFGSYIGLFKNRLATLLVGILLGATLTWVATLMVKRRQAKIP